MFVSFVVSPFVQGKRKEYLEMIMIRMIQLEKEELEGKLGEVERERVEGVFGILTFFCSPPPLLRGHASEFREHLLSSFEHDICG